MTQVQRPQSRDVPRRRKWPWVLLGVVVVLAVLLTVIDRVAVSIAETRLRPR